MNFSPEQISEFKKNGIICIKQAISKKNVESAQKYLESELKRLNISRHAGVPQQLRDIPIFQQIGKLGQMIRQNQTLNELINHDLVHMAEILAANKVKAATPPQLLLSLPNKKNWSIANLNWHLDVNSEPDTPIPGVQIFVLIKDLEIHGGGTLALAGTHRLPKAIQNLKENPEFNKLFVQDVGPIKVNDHEISLIEMHGKAGDIYFMDMRTVHSPSINSTNEIRMMLTNRFLRSKS